ncbi:MAG: transaldolase, partial [Acidobacteria bacterium]|nr:transaldolase [Acidobacteriota bacterium]
MKPKEKNTSVNSFTYSVPDELESKLQSLLSQFDDDRVVARLWRKDASLWTNSDEAKWLGWLDVVDKELKDVERYREFANDITQAGFTDILLMGMGGSSLCPEVLAITFGNENFHILDSTVPAQVKAVEERIDLEKTLFVVASKSGSTLEPNCFQQYFFERVAEKIGRENAGNRFVAITDPASKMEKVAKRDDFRRIFYGEPTIGGRFSALSVFGMATAAAMK